MKTPIKTYIFSLLIFILASELVSMNLVDAMEPYLVEDINDYVNKYLGFEHGDRLVESNGKLFFAGDDLRGSGLELWVTDGTQEGTYIVKDIMPQIGFSSEPNNLIDVNGKLFFTASEEFLGNELWVSDGSAEGTHLVKDIYPGNQSSEPIYLTAVNDKFFFSADEGLYRRLWISDGTEEGTYRLNNAPANPRELTEVNGKLFFSDGSSLWVTDGTDLGTFVIKNFYQYYDGPTDLTEFNGKLFFSAYEPQSGYELWVSDGSAEGTHIVKDIYFGSGWGYPKFLTEVNGSLFFTANGGSPYGPELWVSDGTEAGTHMVKDIFPGNGGPYPEYLININDRLFFRADDGIHGLELWTSDGTEAGTYMVKDIRPGSLSTSPLEFAEFNGKLFFSAFDGIHGLELWTSDGTEAGTYIVKDIYYGFYSSAPQALTEFNGGLYFMASDPVDGRELWVTDGTEENTYRVSDVQLGFSALELSTSMVGAAGSLFFPASNLVYGGELWMSNGTEEDTFMLKDIYPGYYASDITELTQVNDRVFFRANDGVHGEELWVSDGTEDGTFMVKDVNPGSYTSYLDNLTEVNGKLFFSATNYELNTGYELWISDGTEDGTSIVKDSLDPYNGILRGNCNPDRGCFAEVNNLLFYIGYSGSSELMRSDGTEEGTYAITDNLNTQSGPYPYGELIEVDNRLFFIGGEAINGWELWVSDGTMAGTYLVKDIYPGYNTPSMNVHPVLLTSVGNKIFFRANDGVHGYELWTSDGTEEGTYMVKDITPTGSTYVNQLTEVNGLLFFYANDGVHGYELWISDGTESGTHMVKDIYPGAYSSFPFGISEVYGWAVFTANDGIHGYELWFSDGTAEGTFMLMDIWPYANSSNPHPYVKSGSLLYFGANDGVHGRELWAIPFNTEPILESLEVFEIPSQLGDSVTVRGTFCDSDTTSGQGHIAEIDWGEYGEISLGTIVSLGQVDGCDDMQQVTANHVYNSPGVYTVKMTVTDDDGAYDSMDFQYAVIYDPNGGFVTGGGWIDSPAGAYTADQALIGKANFGFVSKYKKGATVPTGTTEFQFKVADLNFQSDSYEWLVVTGSNYAKFKGEGTINGDGFYKFQIWAGDGTGSNGSDTFRIKIWVEYELTGEEIVLYDNGFDQDIAGGSIVVHTKQ